MATTTAHGQQIALIAGIPIRGHPSWLLVYALITWTLVLGYFPSEVERLGVGRG